MNIPTSSTHLMERIRTNDPTLGQVSVGGRSNFYSPYNNSQSPLASLVSISSDEIEAIVRALGKNTYVEQFEFCIPSNTTYTTNAATTTPLGFENNDSSNSNSCSSSCDNTNNILTTNQMQQPSSRDIGNNNSIHDNNYDFIRESLEANTSLRKLIASSASVSSVSTSVSTYVSSTFSSTTSENSNSNNNLYSSKNDDDQNTRAWISLCEGLQLNTTIEEVTFGDETLGELVELSYDVCCAIATFVAAATKLKKLSFRGFSISIASATIVADGLAQNSSIRSLQLCQIESDGLDIILEALSETSITHLSIVDCDIDYCNNYGDNYDDDCSSMNDSNHFEHETLHPFFTLTKFNHNIIVLKITDCILGNDEISSLCKGLQTNTSIKYLDLSGNEMLANVCISISSMLQYNSSLQHLILEDNIIGETGFQHICKGLQFNQSLLKFNVRSNHISNNGLCDPTLLINAFGGEISNSLSSTSPPTTLTTNASSTKCSKLHALFLSENDIGDSGIATIVAPIIKHSTTLDVLELDACGITDPGIIALAHAMIDNKTITELNISNNIIQEKGAKALSTMLSSNKSIISLHLSSCRIDDTTLQYLLQSLTNHQNSTLQELWLSFNPFGNDGLFHLSEMMRLPSSLSSNIGNKNKQQNVVSLLGIQFCGFDSLGLRHLLSAMEFNVHMQQVFVWNGSKDTLDGSQCIDQLDYWCGLNRSGRRVIGKDENSSSSETSKATTNESLWPTILARADQIDGPNSVLHFLCEVPSICSYMI